MFLEPGLERLRAIIPTSKHPEHTRSQTKKERQRQRERAIIFRGRAEDSSRACISLHSRRTTGGICHARWRRKVGYRSWRRPRAREETYQAFALLQIYDYTGTPPLPFSVATDTGGSALRFRNVLCIIFPARRSTLVEVSETDHFLPVTILHPPLLQPSSLLHRLG